LEHLRNRVFHADAHCEQLTENSAFWHRQFSKELDRSLWSGQWPIHKKISSGNQWSR